MDRYIDWDIFRCRLVQLRSDHNLRRSVLSELCGLHSNAIAEYERAEYVPSMETAAKIADYFDVSVDYLIGRE